MDEIVSVTPGLQCCLLCGRVLTDRALHDRLEEPVLASIRAEHPEWTGTDGACAPCVSVYRKLLEERMTRAVRMRAGADDRRLWARMSSLFGRGKTSAAANQPNA